MIHLRSLSPYPGVRDVERSAVCQRDRPEFAVEDADGCRRIFAELEATVR